MHSHLHSLVRRGFFVSLLVLVTATPVFSQQQDGRAKQGGYAAVTVMPKFTFDGKTFDGLGVYQEIGGDEFAILPLFGEQTLTRFALGHRWRRAALEVSYDRVQPEGAFEGFAVDSTFQSINVDARLFFLANSPVQPYGLFGGSFPWLTITDGSVLNDEVGDARFRGWGLNAEGGLAVYPHPRLGLLAGYSFRTIWFDRVSGVTDTLFDLRPRFRETANGFTVTAMFTF